MPISKTIATLVKEIHLWLRLATFLHEPLKLFLLYILHNLASDPSYIGLPQNPQQLYQELPTKHHKKIQKLVNKKVLQRDQLELILPKNGNSTDSDKFDVTLICILIRNFTKLPAPQNGWDDKNPPPNDTSIAALVIRAREWRNFLHHNEPKDIKNNLGFTYHTNKLKTISLDPQHETVLKSIFSYLAQLNRKQDALTQQQTSTNQDVAKLTQQVSSIDQNVMSLIQQLSSTNQNVASLIQQQTLTDKDLSNFSQHLSTTDQNVANLAQKLEQNLLTPKASHAAKTGKK